MRAKSPKNFWWQSFVSSCFSFFIYFFLTFLSIIFYFCFILVSLFIFTSFNYYYCSYSTSNDYLFANFSIFSPTVCNIFITTHLTRRCHTTSMGDQLQPRTGPRTFRFNIIYRLCVRTIYK